MAKTSVEVDSDILQEAAAVLGTTTLRATIDAALREVVRAQRRLALIALLADGDQLDFEQAEAAWGGDHPTSG